MVGMSVTKNNSTKNLKLFKKILFLIMLRSFRGQFIDLFVEHIFVVNNVFFLRNNLENDFLE